MNNADHAQPLPARCLALLLTVCIVVFSLAASSPTLHKKLHVDSHAHCSEHGHHSEDEDGSHVCAVTLLEVGAVAFLCLQAPKPQVTKIERIHQTHTKISFAPSALSHEARAPPADLFV